MAKTRGAHTFRPRVRQGPSSPAAGPSSTAAGSPAADLAASTVYYPLCQGLPGSYGECTHILSYCGFFCSFTGRSGREDDLHRGFYSSDPGQHHADREPLGLPASSPQDPAQPSVVPHQTGSAPSPPTPAASLDVLAAAAASATSPTTAPQPAQAEDEPSPATD